MSISKNKRQFTVSVLSSLIALALAGCGGSDGSDSESSSTSSYSIQAIDGYLVNADVYADIDGSNTYTSADTLITTTGENGTATIPAEYKDYSLIVKIKAGVTSDSDSGVVTSNKQLIAEAGSAVITPFSTYAVQTNQTLEEVATSLNVDVSTINSDYVAAQSNSDTTTSNSATKAHLLARSINQTLAESLAAEDTDTLTSTVTKISSAVDETYAEAENNGTVDELNDEVVTVDDSGSAAVESQSSSSLLNNMAGNTYYGMSTNNAYLVEEGLAIMTVGTDDNSDNIVTISVTNDKNTTPYSVEATFSGNQYSFTEDSETSTETSLYYADDALNSAEITLQVTNDGDLYYYTTQNINGGFSLHNITASELIGKTFYMIFDDAGDSSKTSDPTFVTLAFDSEAVTVTEGTESSTHSWSINSDGELVIEDFANDNGDSWSVKAVAQTDSLLVVATEIEGIPVFLFNDKDTANNVYATWNSLLD